MHLRSLTVYVWQTLIGHGLLLTLIVILVVVEVRDLLLRVRNHHIRGSIRLDRRVHHWILLHHRLIQLIVINAASQQGIWWKLSLLEATWPKSRSSAILRLEHLLRWLFIVFATQNIRGIMSVDALIALPMILRAWSDKLSILIRGLASLLICPLSLPILNKVPIQEFVFSRI